MQKRAKTTVSRGKQTTPPAAALTPAPDRSLTPGIRIRGRSPHSTNEVHSAPLIPSRTSILHMQIVTSQLRPTARAFKAAGTEAYFPDTFPAD